MLNEWLSLKFTLKPVNVWNTVLPNIYLGDMSAQVEFYSYIILSRIIVYYKKTPLIFQVKMCETAYFTHLQGVQNY